MAPLLNDVNSPERLRGCGRGPLLGNILNTSEGTVPNLAGPRHTFREQRNVENKCIPHSPFLSIHRGNKCDDV